MNFEQERRALIRIRTCPRLELQDTSKSQLYSMKVKALVDKTSQTVIKDLPPPGIVCDIFSSQTTVITRKL